LNDEEEGFRFDGSYPITHAIKGEEANPFSAFNRYD
jgi:hypothetical protein